ncbi:MAG: cytochrome C oxidase subunit IV family protein [Rhodothermales bacterium]
MAHAAHQDKHHGHHIIPKKTLGLVFAALVVLTILTALTAQLDLGSFNVPLALAIALTKASLVVAFFMALKYDNRVNVLVFSVGAIFVVVFLVFTLFDTAFRGSLNTMEPGVIAAPVVEPGEEAEDHGTADELATPAEEESEETPPADVVAADPEEATTEPAVEPSEEADDTTTADADVSVPEAEESGDVPAVAPAEMGEDAVERGRLLYEQRVCNACHSLDGAAGVGPSFKGVFGSQRTFTDGSSATADEDYLRESITQPNAKLVEGFGPVMPPAYGDLTPEDLDALIAFIKAQQ